MAGETLKAYEKHDAHGDVTQDTPSLTHIPSIIVSRKRRGEVVSCYLKQRNALIHQLKLMEEKLLDDIIPVKVGDTILFNMVHGNLTMDRVAGVIMDIVIQVGITDVFVFLYIKPVDLGIPFSHISKPKLLKTTKKIKISFNDVLAVIYKKDDTDRLSNQ